MNDLGAKLDAKGQDGAQARSEITAQAGLTNQEAQALNAVAADYRTTNNAILALIVSLAASSASASNAQQIQNLQDQRKQNVLSHIAQLQTALGSARFLQFEAYVHGTTHVKAYSLATGTGTPQPGKNLL